MSAAHSGTAIFLLRGKKIVLAGSVSAEKNYSIFRGASEEKKEMTR